jgi:hypothetical protein
MKVPDLQSHPGIESVDGQSIVLADYGLRTFPTTANCARNQHLGRAYEYRNSLLDG